MNFLTKTLLAAGALALLSSPTLLFAQETVVFTPLTGLPGLTDVSSADAIGDFLNVIYRLCVGIAATLAVLKIIQAGVMYMRSDSITGHKEARDIIKTSLLGLVLVLSPAIVFGLIDPRILSLSLNTTPLQLSELAPQNPSGGLNAAQRQVIVNEVVAAAQACGVQATEQQGRCFLDSMPDTERTRACIPGITDAQFQCMGEGIIEAGERMQAEENRCQAVAPITEGKMVSEQYQNCCALAGFQAVRYGFRNVNYMCTNSPPEQETSPINAAEGTYNFVLYALSSDETCVQLVHGSYPDQSTCTARLAEEQNSRPQYTPLYSCVIPPLNTSLFNKPVCSNITTAN